MNITQVLECRQNQSMKMNFSLPSTLTQPPHLEVPSGKKLFYPLLDNTIERSSQKDWLLFLSFKGRYPKSKSIQAVITILSNLLKTFFPFILQLSN